MSAKAVRKMLMKLTPDVTNRVGEEEQAKTSSFKSFSSERIRLMIIEKYF